MDVRGTGRFAALKTALGQRQLDRRMAGVLHGAVFLLLGLTLSSARVSEHLKYRKEWSRHIDHGNRLVYDIVDGNLWIIACKGHYED